MTALWWLALPLLLLPILWHRQKRERVTATLLATARFLPRADPQQRRVWQWVDRVLLLVRCLLLATLIAWLADLALPWRGDTVLVVAGTDAAWAAREIDAAGFKGAQRIEPGSADAIAWFTAREREWRADARVLVIGGQPMAATMPGLRHALELRTVAPAEVKRDVHVAIAGKRADQWRALFAAIDGPVRYLVDEAPSARAGSALFEAPETAPRDAAAARALIERWQRLAMPAVPYVALTQTLAADPRAPLASDGGLRDLIAYLLVGLLAIERSLTHARRR
jgi:hypothetical protein